MSPSPRPKKAAKSAAVRRRSSASGPVVAPFAAMLAADWDRAPTLVSADELARHLDVNTRTITNYVGAGMPVHTKKPRPLYSLSDCLIWGTGYAIRLAIARATRATPPQRIELRHAIEDHLRREAKSGPGFGTEYTVVPLRHDHPLRGRMLKAACDGLPALANADDFDTEAA